MFMCSMRTIHEQASQGVPLDGSHIEARGVQRPALHCLDTSVVAFPFNHSANVASAGRRKDQRKGVEATRENKHVFHVKGESRRGR